jgi:phospholipase/carboxylesterase
MSVKAERLIDLGGLPTTVIGPEDALEGAPEGPPLTLVLLHGYSMRPADLAPFAHSIGVPALFLLPQGPVSNPAGGHAWWAVDPDAREAAIAAGPRDLSDDYPRGLAAAREHLGRFLDAATARFQPRQLVLGGFSQGGMLSLDWVLRGSRPMAALVLLSASRLSMSDWWPHRARLQNLPVFVSHGATDPDLAFAAGERLRDFVLESGARGTWVSFGGGHEIPFVVWRGLRKFLGALLE